MIEENTVLVYTADVSALEDDELFNKIYEKSSSYRRGRTDNMKFRKDKNLSLGAEYLLMLALKESGIDYENLPIKTHEFSKPYIVSSDVFFNISHSEKKVMCVLSDKPVGCDVEKIKNENLNTAKRFFSKEEYSFISSFDNEKERNDAFFRLWVLKESFMKCTGLGFNLPLSEFSVIPKGDNIILKQNIDNSVYSFKEFNIDDGYRYALCINESYGKEKKFGGETKISRKYVTIDKGIVL